MRRSASELFGAILGWMGRSASAIICCNNCRAQPVAERVDVELRQFIARQLRPAGRCQRQIALVPYGRLVQPRTVRMPKVHVMSIIVRPGAIGRGQQALKPLRREDALMPARVYISLRQLLLLLFS